MNVLKIKTIELNEVMRHERPILMPHSRRRRCVLENQSFKVWNLALFLNCLDLKTYMDDMLIKFYVPIY